MDEKPTYEELEQRVKELEQEKLEHDRMKDVPIQNLDLHAVINAEEIQSIMDDFHYLTNMATAVLDLQGNVIEATGWQDICTKFHRINPETARNCTESDLFLARNLKPGEYIEYKCKNGLRDIVTPLHVGAKHLGNIYTGQFFYDDEPVAEDYFIRQAEAYGFDQDSYMDAFRRIPRYSRETITHLMDFLVKFTSYISRISFANIQLEKEIRDRKRAEEEIIALNRDLELRVHQRTVALEEANKELEDFVYSVSHDLRAPLRSISGFAQIIDRRHKASLNEEGRHYFENIVKASGQMGELIDDLLNFSRLGRKAITSENVPLDDVFKSVMETLSDPMEKTGTRVNLPERMPVIQGDLTLTTHIFINLLENAVKYRKPDEPPCIDVAFEVDDQMVTVSVSDNGIGIEPAYHEKIFNIFQRLHSQADYPGTGIGLAAVKKAVQIMGGRVWAESALGKGSVFKIKVLTATTAESRRTPQ